MIQQRSIHGHRRIAVQRIDEAAEQARLRYISSFAGQDMVHAVKLAQARAYVTAYAANVGARVPAYIAAEAAATGGTAQAAAQAIIDAADAFHTGPGPAIEQARRAGKLAVQAASTVEAVAQALADTVAALAAV